MHIYDLSFADGKSCRCIVMEPCADTSEDIKGATNIFKPGYLQSMDRVMAPAPTKIPWKKQAASLWTCQGFALSRLESGQFHCFWPGGEITGGKDEISAAVRENWQKGQLT